jgi:hypothetical protein
LCYDFKNAIKLYAMKNNFSLPALAWIVLTTLCVALILTGLKVALKKTGWEKSRQRNVFFGTAVVIAVWAVLLLILSYKGFFADFSTLPPRPALALFIPLPFIILTALSKPGKELLQSIPPHWLVWMQSFRIVVELLLLFAFIAGKLPVQMTLEGRNFDVATGLLALPVGYVMMRMGSPAKRLAIFFNILGLLLLMNILVIAVLSMPTPLQYFMNEPSNTLVAQFPFILLPGVLVPIAYGLHIFSLKQLLIREERRVITNS